MTFFCFGLGYTGLALALRLRDEGWRVGGTCRTPEKERMLRDQGIEAYIFTNDQDLPKNTLTDYRYILHSIPPQGEGEGRISECYSTAQAVWVGYLSTTGVYGDRNGAWVDETTPPRPTGERQRRRAYVEGQWLDLARRLDVKTHIFRLAGIYGPKRNVLTALRSRTARRIDKPGHMSSRVHVDDIVECLLASMAQPRQGGEVYNVCDNVPAPSHEVVTYGCRLLGIEPPPLIGFEQASLSSMARSFYLDNRRVSNRKMKRELGLTLRFPSYREGLEDILARGLV